MPMAYALLSTSPAKVSVISHGAADNRVAAPPAGPAVAGCYRELASTLLRAPSGAAV